MTTTYDQWHAHRERAVRQLDRELNRTLRLVLRRPDRELIRRSISEEWTQD